MKQPVERDLDRPVGRDLPARAVEPDDVDRRADLERLVRLRAAIACGDAREDRERCAEASAQLSE
jgi:hypothetical protein